MNTLPKPLELLDRNWVREGGRRLLYFGGCDYFRLSSHPAVHKAIALGLQREGLSVSASRKTTGNHAIYEKLEAELAGFFGAGRALLVPNGYASNLAAAQTLAGGFVTACIDQYAHYSLWDAAQLLGCKVVPFQHRDVSDLGRIVREVRGAGKCILLTDGIFSRSGALAPLGQYLEVLPRDAWLLVDDAHAAGLHGRAGQGTLEREGVGRRRNVQTITLSKAFGAFGGVVLGTEAFCSDVVRRSRIFAGSTPLPLPLVQAARQSLRILKGDRSLRRRLAGNTARLKDQLRTAGFRLPDYPSPIIGLEPHRRLDVLWVQKQLQAAGIHPPFTRYGSGLPRGCFRFVISSEHTAEHLDRLSAVLVACRARLQPVV